MKRLMQSAFFLAVFMLLNVKSNAMTALTDSIALNQPAPGCNLKDGSGKTLYLSSLKGKIVVLNFWATWCVPCHENFPFLQKTVKYYKKDKNVVFLFIDTREKSPDYIQLAKDDLKKNNYNFQILYDELGEDGKQNKYYKIFGMAGIPTQFIIDSQGIIRYKSVGYDPLLTDNQKSNQLIKQIDSLK